MRRSSDWRSLRTASELGRQEARVRRLMALPNGGWLLTMRSPSIWHGFVDQFQAPVVRHALGQLLRSGERQAFVNGLDGFRFFVADIHEPHGDFVSFAIGVRLRTVEEGHPPGDGRGGATGDGRWSWLGCCGGGRGHLLWGYFLMVIGVLVGGP